MEPTMTVIILRGIYGVCGMIAFFQGWRLYAIRNYLKTTCQLDDDHEDVKAVTRRHKLWATAMWIAIILLLIT